VKVVLALLVLLGLAVAGDRAAVAVVDRSVASWLQQAGGLATAPDVAVRGFPFLTQAVAGRYDRVDIRVRDVRAGDLRIGQLDGEFQGVRLPLADVLSGPVAQLPVARLDARAVLSYADIGALSGSRRLSVAPGADGRVRVTGSIQVLGRTVSATALSRVELAGAQLVVTAEGYEVGNATADAVLTRALGGRLDLRIGLGGLPYGLNVTAVQAEPDGVVMTAQASDVVLAPSSGTSPAR